LASKPPSYSFTRYPPLGFFINVRWFIIIGAFLMAACSRVQFLFPCVGGASTLHSFPSVARGEILWRAGPPCNRPPHNSALTSPPSKIQPPLISRAAATACCSSRCPASLPLCAPLMCA
jgi:hypothetical protein